MKKVKMPKIVIFFLFLFICPPIYGFYAFRGNFTSIDFQKNNIDFNVKSSLAEYEVIQITSNDINDYLGCIEDGLIVWTSDILGNGNKEIFLYNVFTGEITQITDNDYDDTQPRVDNGIITWIGKVDDDYEVFLYATFLSSPEPFRVTYNNVNDFVPFIHEGLITWYSSDSKIWLYDCNNNELIQVSENYNSGNYPKVHNGLITWMGVGDIWLYDYYGVLNTPRHTIQITTDSYTNLDSFPYINDGLLIWHSKQEVDGKPFIKLFLYDCYKKETHHIGDPKYSYGKMVHDGLVVYGGQDPEGPEGDEEIFLYNYSSRITTQITFNDVYDEAPVINDGIVAWSRTYQIFIYDSFTGETTKITDRGSGFSVFIEDGYLTWSSRINTGGDYEIFLAKPAFITANLNIEPNTLNLKCKGKFVSGYIELPAGYNLDDIDITTILLQYSIPAEISPTIIGDFDEDGIPDLMVKFNRADLQSMVSEGEFVEVSISGALTNGILFSGVDIIKVIDEGVEHVNEDDPSSVE